MKYLSALSLSLSVVRSVVSRHAPSGPRFLHIITVSPVKRVGASVSVPHSSALAMKLLVVVVVRCRGEVKMASETAALVSVRDNTVTCDVEKLLLSAVSILDLSSSLLFAACNCNSRVGEIVHARCWLVENAAPPTVSKEKRIVLLRRSILLIIVVDIDN